jgi:cytochrome c
MGSRQGYRCGRLRVRARAAAHRVTIALCVTALHLAASLTPALAAGNAASGKQLYQTRCLGCHGDGRTANTLGPSLIGIIGRKAGTGESGVHSRIMTESGITWNETWLRIFLAAPTKEMPGTIMPVGVPDAQEIDDLIAYLKTLR